jgi:hypothetical protein
VPVILVINLPEDVADPPFPPEEAEPLEPPLKKELILLGTPAIIPF